MLFCSVEQAQKKGSFQSMFKKKQETSDTMQYHTDLILYLLEKSNCFEHTYDIQAGTFHVKAQTDNF